MLSIREILTNLIVNINGKFEIVNKNQSYLLIAAALVEN